MTHEATVAKSAEVPAESRDELASKLVDRFALWSGAAGLIPLPVIDIAAVGGVQIQMLRRLSEIYGIPFSENVGKSIIASFAGSLIPASSAVGVASALKGIPAFGTAISALMMPGLAASATYLIGKVFLHHFASGGTLLDFNLPDYREFIKAQKDKLSTHYGSAPTTETHGAKAGSTQDAAKEAPSTANESLTVPKKRKSD